MAYQLALMIGNSLASTQFESFTLDRHSEVSEYKVVGGPGHSEIIEHIPGRSSLGPLTLTRRMDADSRTFQQSYQSILDGKYQQTKTTMELICADTSGNELFRYTFYNAWVSSIIASGNRHGGTAPEEQIQIAFDTVSLTFA